MLSTTLLNQFLANILLILEIYLIKGELGIRHWALVIDNS